MIGEFYRLECLDDDCDWFRRETCSECAEDIADRHRRQTGHQIHSSSASGWKQLKEMTGRAHSVLLVSTKRRGW